MPLQAVLCGRQRANPNARPPTSDARLPTLSCQPDSADEGHANNRATFSAAVSDACLRKGAMRMPTRLPDKMLLTISTTKHVQKRGANGSQADPVPIPPPSSPIFA